MSNEKTDFAPVVVKFGVAVALSLGGIMYTLIVNKRSKVSESSHEPCKRLDCNKQMNLRSIPRVSQTSQSSLNFDPLETDKYEELRISNNPDNESPRGNRQDQEIKNLRNTVKILKEREHNLEIELLEYYGLKQQETTVMELQNRLKLHNMEAKIFTLKMESLQGDNRRLEARMSDYKKVVADFEAARAKVKMLKKRIKFEAEQNKKQMLDFHERVQRIQEDEHENKLRLEKIKGLELEVEELRKSKHENKLRLEKVKCLELEVEELRKSKHENKLRLEKIKCLELEVEELRKSKHENKLRLEKVKCLELEVEELRKSKHENKLRLEKVKCLELEVEELRKSKHENKLRLERVKCLELEVEELRKSKHENKLRLEKIKCLELEVEELRKSKHENKLRLEKVKSLESEIKGLELEVEELRKSNNDLMLENTELGHRLETVQTENTELGHRLDTVQIENTELGHRLDTVQILATSVLEDAETEELKEECNNLKKQNEDLSKEVERLQADRCTDVEEVVYLKWINACLRYELRNYQPGHGKTTARDLSKTLSPKSQEKAKQMILEYANKEGGLPENGINIPETDSGRWSQASGIADPTEFDEPFIGDQTPRKSNYKFFGKLIRVLRGKDSRSNSPNPHNNHRRNHSRTSSAGDEINLVNSPEFQKSKTSSSWGFFKPSLKPLKLKHRHSDTSFYKEVDSSGGGDSSGGRGGRRSCSPPPLDGKKSELTKYAEALKETRVRPTIKTYNRSSSALDFF